MAGISRLRFIGRISLSLRHGSFLIAAANQSGFVCFYIRGFGMERVPYGGIGFKVSSLTFKVLRRRFQGFGIMGFSSSGFRVCSSMGEMATSWGSRLCEITKQTHSEFFAVIYLCQNVQK
jgi:hypothetical protein